MLLCVQLTAEVSDPGEYDTIFTYDWQIFKDGQLYQSGSDSAITFLPDVVGTYDIQLQVTDKDGAIGSETISITADDVAPTAQIGFTSSTLMKPRRTRPSTSSGSSVT